MRRRAPRRDERGQAAVLVVGFAVLLLMVTVAVVDSSAAFLRRQSLDNLADGAALSGADAGARGSDIYTGGLGSGPGDPLQITAGAARAGVEEYLRQVGAHRRYPGLRVEGVQVREDRVEVTLTAPVDFPLTMPGLPLDARVGATGSAVVAADRAA